MCFCGIFSSISQSLRSSDWALPMRMMGSFALMGRRIISRKSAVRIRPSMGAVTQNSPGFSMMALLVSRKRPSCATLVARRTLANSTSVLLPRSGVLLNSWMNRSSERISVVSSDTFVCRSELNMRTNACPLRTSVLGLSDSLISKIWPSCGA